MPQWSPEPQSQESFASYPSPLVVRANSRLENGDSGKALKTEFEISSDCSIKQLDFDFESTSIIHGSYAFPRWSTVGGRHASLPDIAAADVIRLTGPQYMIDNLWAQEFGAQIEYRYRAIPYQLLYLLHKYGPIIPHGFFVESIQEVCGTTGPKPESPRFEDPDDPTSVRPDREREDLSVAEAKELIAEAVALGLITEVIAPNDKRYKLYKISLEQLAKLNRIREREARIYAINDQQAANPNNVEAGKTEAVQAGTATSWKS